MMAGARWATTGRAIRLRLRLALCAKKNPCAQRKHGTMHCRAVQTAGRDSRPRAATRVADHRSGPAHEQPFSHSLCLVLPSAVAALAPALCIVRNSSLSYCPQQQQLLIFYTAAVALGLVFSSSSTRSCQLQQPQLSPWLAAIAALAFAYSGRILCSLYC